MNLVGSVLAGRYEIVEEVGSGGMAIVYKAKCRILNRYVAIKVLRPDLKDDGDFVRRFNIEAQSAASLTHPNIVSIYDVGTDGDIHYIVMEYVEGITLKEYIDKNGTLNWHEAVGYANQIASGLEQAHKNSIVHRDIKPHNIIMTPEGVLKITDFGIARASMQSTVNCDDTAIGSVHYVSPEQARGGYVDERSDIYSLGIVLYEMLTGKVPFDNESPVTIALMHLQTKPTPPRELNLSIPKAVEDIVLKAITKEVSSRYKSISDMKNELAAVADAPAPTPEKAPEIDELGGTAVFSAAKDIPEIEDIIYPNNQAPSAKSNLIPDTPSEKEEQSSPDIPIDFYDDDDEEDNVIMATRKPAKSKKSNAGRIAVIIAALVASLAVMIFVGTMFGGYFAEVFSSCGGGRTVTVDQFRYKYWADIEKQYKDSDEYEFVIEYDEDENEEDGIILEQYPAPDNVITTDGKVTVTLTVNRLNEDDDDERLANYRGEDAEAAIKELKSLGIKVNDEYEFDDRYAENEVIDQSVSAGTKISEIDEITITISKGKKEEDKNDEEKEPDNEDVKKPETSSSPSPKPDEGSTTQQANRKRLTIYGPTEKSSAHVEVKVNGKVIKSVEMAKGSSDVVTIQSSSPSVKVEVFHDGVLVLTQTVNME